MKTIKLIFPHQLFEFNPVFTAEGSIYLVEESLFFNQFNFHKQKIAFHRASMKCYEGFLLEKGSSVTYIEAHEPEGDIRILIKKLKKLGTGYLVIVDPIDNWLLKLNRMEDNNL
jgi:deoxyribodipyrimidine photolyase-related protein